MLKIKTTDVGPLPMFHHYCTHCVFIRTITNGDHPVYDAYVCEAEGDHGSVVLRHGDAPANKLVIGINDVKERWPSLNELYHTDNPSYHTALAAHTALEQAWRRGFITRVEE